MRMNVVSVQMRADDIFIPPAQHTVCKFFCNPVRKFRCDLACSKTLHKVIPLHAARLVPAFLGLPHIGKGCFQRAGIRAFKAGLLCFIAVGGIVEGVLQGYRRGLFFVHHILHRPELKAKIEACRPDLLVLTGDIFDEFTEPEELDAFCKLFGELDAPLGKYYVLGNHDLFHHWREPSFGRADLERGFAAAGVRILEDTSVLLPCGVRIVGRKDYLYTNGSRFTAAQLMPGGPDDHYTVWLDHEPRDFKNAAAAGADLILSGHTHGGQVWPAGAVGMVAKNERNYGRKHIADHCDAIVSGGTGTWGYKFRTQGRTEIVCAEITTEREN